MGTQSSIKRQRRGEIIHRTKLWGGVRTAEEVNATEGFRQPCQSPGCGNMPVVQVKMFMLLNDFVEKSPQFAAAIAMTNPNGSQTIPCVPMTFGPMVMFSKVAACRSHQRELELEAAKAPSSVLVEFNRGPGADKPQVQSAGIRSLL